MLVLVSILLVVIQLVCLILKLRRTFMILHMERRYLDVARLTQIDAQVNLL